MKKLVIALLFVASSAFAQGTGGGQSGTGGSGGGIGLTVQNNGTSQGTVSAGTAVLNLISGCSSAALSGTTFGITCTGGSGDTITSPNSTLTVGGTSTATTLDLNLGHANTWTANQTVPTLTATTSILPSASATVPLGSSGVPFSQLYLLQVGNTTGVDVAHIDCTSNAANTGNLLNLIGNPASPGSVFSVDCATGNTIIGGTAVVSSNLTANGTSGVAAPNGPLSSGSTTITSALAGTATGVWACAEGSTAVTPTTGGDSIRCDSTAHQYKLSLNAGSEFVSAMNYAVTNTTAFPFQSITTTGSSGAATLSGGVLNIPQYSGGGTPSFPVTVAGTVTSGGIPYFSSTTQESSSGLLTQYGVVFGGGAGGAPTSSAQGGSNFPLIGQGAANPIFSTIAYPTSLTSGGLLYASSTTAIASSSLITANVLVKSGGAGTAPAASTITDNATVISTTEGLSIAPTSTSQVGLIVNNPTSTSVNIAAFETNGTVEASVGNTGIVNALLGFTTTAAAPTATAGTAGFWVGTEGTAPSSLAASTDALYMSSTGGCPDWLHVGTDNGCLLAAGNATLTAVLTVPVGTTTAPSVQATGSASNTGLFLTTTAGVWDSTGSAVAAMVSGGFEVADNKAFAFSQTSGATGAAGANFTVVGTGTTENMTPSSPLLMPQCKPTSAITLTSQTTICSWTLPNSAQTWSWQCQGIYSTTTTAISMTLGMVAAQTPTSETGNAIIYTTSSMTGTSGSATATTTTATTILAGGSVASATSNLPWMSSGTVQASGTSGTFILYGTASTSSDVTVNVGTTCQLY